MSRCQWSAWVASVPGPKIVVNQPQEAARRGANMIRRRVMMMMTTETAASGGVGWGRGGRLSRQRKRDAVLRLLRGEDLETLSRALGATAAPLTGWQDTLAEEDAKRPSREREGLVRERT